MRLRIVAVLPLALALAAVPATAQLHLQIGGGSTHSLDSALGTGAHLQGALRMATPWRPLHLRVDALASVAHFAYVGREPGEPDEVPARRIDRGTRPLLGASAGLQVEGRVGSWQPYLFGGLGYYHSEWSRSEPTAHDFGLAGGVGVARRAWGREWFAEAGVRTFGNVFYEASATKTIIPLSLGLRG
jgi:hypothetical protein